MEWALTGLISSPEFVLEKKIASPDWATYLFSVPVFGLWSFGFLPPAGFGCLFSLRRLFKLLTTNELTKLFIPVPVLISGHFVFYLQRNLE